MTTTARFGLVVCLACAGTVATAESVPTMGSLGVDFRMGEWAQGSPVTSLTIGGLQAIAEPSGSFLTHSTTFGLGVAQASGLGTSLIENTESIRFVGAQNITGVWVRGFGALEEATVEVIDRRGGTRIFGFGSPDGTPQPVTEDFFVEFGGVISGTVVVSATITDDLDRLGVLGFTSVPIPSAGLLGAAGLGLLGTVRRR